MTQEPTTDTKPSNRDVASYCEQLRRGILLMAGAVFMYLLLTGPLLWSYSRFDNAAWRSFVKLTVTPIVYMDKYRFEHSQAAAVPQILLREGEHPPLICIDPPEDGIDLPVEDYFNFRVLEDPFWLSGLKSYWQLFENRSLASYRQFL